MGVLAIINLGVIVQGCFSCYHKIQGFPKKTFNIIMFYVLAFLSLATAILYCLSWTLDRGGRLKGDNCFYYLIESLPAFVYLLCAFVYLTQSLSVMLLQCDLATNSREKKKKRRINKIRNIIFYSVCAVLIVVYGI